jgi:hypothetical protein
LPRVAITGMIARGRTIMKFTFLAAGFFLAGVLPQSAAAQDARITPVMSTTTMRSCQSEATTTILVREGQPVANPMPAIEKRRVELGLKPSGDGYAISNVTDSPEGRTGLELTTDATGAIRDARKTGRALELGLSATQLSELARTAGEDLPERLLIGRSFMVGDSYYPDALRSTLMRRMVDQIGLPLESEGTLDLTYRGEAEHLGRRVWAFEGPVTLRGEGALQGGVTVLLQMNGSGRVLHDAETGLVLRYELRMETRIDLDGATVARLEASDVWDCRLVPG